MDEESDGDMSIADRVRQLERDSEQLGTIRATLWLNYGSGLECKNKAGFTIEKDKSTLRMLLAVLDKLTNKASEPML